MELEYTKTGDYELPNLTLNNNKKGTRQCVIQGNVN